ncbi:unnamed protein product [Candidula unifasciata]|uniref:Lebercilin domain-containing protein n=1 Tax=Candidula unifasciata TaxID=100452 RepID=A0A8S3ZPX9_9EUPU|nr:unnamed protein product [Candidula unifasciata]
MSGKQSYAGEVAATADRYSNHFESDEEIKASKQKGTPPLRKATGYLNKSHGRRRRSDSLIGRVQGQGLRRGRGNSRKNSQASESIDMKQHDSFTTRVLSASRNRINELRNKVEELQIKIRELEQENKMFKTLQFRHEKAIRNIKDQESDLPMILDKHNSEIRSLKEQNRRLREKCEKSDRFLRDAEDELEKVKKKMKKYRELVEDKELLERDDLSRRIAKVELEMEEKEIKIKEFERHIEILKKNHKHEIGIEIARQKDLKKQLEELKKRNSQLEHQLKEKERALGYQNLHNLHKGKSSRSNSPNGSLARRIDRKAASMTELSLREKAKFYSERQQADLQKQQELKESKKGKKLQKQKAKGRNTAQMRPPEFPFQSTSGILVDSGDQRDKERQSVVMETTQRTGKELDTEREQQDADKQVKYGITKDKVTTGSLQDQEPRRIKRDRLESERSDTGEMQETSLFETTEKRKGKTQENKEKVESDLVLQAERKRKDDLLKRLKALDEANITTPGTVAPAAPFKSHQDKPQGLDVFDELSFTTTTRSLQMFSLEGTNTAQGKTLEKR